MQLVAPSRERDAGTADSGRRRWLVFAAAFGTIPAFMLSLGVVLAAALRDSDLVGTRAGLRSVDLGWPLVWVHQDQSALAPPFPHSMVLASPWENPTSVSWAAFMVNLLIVFTVVAVVGLLLSALVVALVRRFRAQP